MKNILVAGGGIIGLTTAYYLAEAGHQVTVIDKNDFLTNCTTGNAGLIVPSHFVPLASPGIVWQGIKWLLNPSSPFSMNFKPDYQLLRWALKFWAACNHQHVEETANTLLDFNLLSKKLYRDLSIRFPQIEFCERGLLMLCKLPEKLKEEYTLADKALRMGLEIIKMDRESIQELEPHAGIDVTGGVLYKSDAQISPAILAETLLNLLPTLGVSLKPNTELKSFIKNGNKVTGIVVNDGVINFDEMVLAAGVFSQDFLGKLGFKANVEAGKGYSFVQNGIPKLYTPLILVEARVAITPYVNFTRYAGAMEIGGYEGVIKYKKVEGMVNSVNKYLPGLELALPNPTDVWTGLRPCSTDGLPYIGRSAKYKNVIAATGHSMMGVSLAPATGKVVEELVSGKKLSFNIEPFSPLR